MPGDWDTFLSNPENYNLVAPVDFFPHAPFHLIWDDFAKTGRKIEVINPFVDCIRPVMWIATIVQFCGYKALIEYERFGLLPKHYAWISYCSYIPRQIGFCDKMRVVLYPQHDVRRKYQNYLENGRKSLKDCDTIEDNHGKFVEEHIGLCQKYAIGDAVEVLDRTNISRMRLAQVASLIGDRIHVTYLVEPQPNDPGFWFSVNSDLVHPIGWSRSVGHSLYDSTSNVPDLDASNFPDYPANIILCNGQFLEARHPLKPYKIAVAVVQEILGHGYFVVSFITTKREQEKPVLFTFHLLSPYIFSYGFCAKHKIDLVPLYGAKQMEILDENKAPLHLLPERPPNKFTTALKLETIDILSPILIYPATVIRVVGHLINLHFDGWSWDDPACFLWTDSCSPDIYPVGYAELVGHSFSDHSDDPNPSDLSA